MCETEFNVGSWDENSHAATNAMRARDLCQALDLPIEPKNVENIRSKLQRLVSRGILTETESGLFTQPCLYPSEEP